MRRFRLFTTTDGNLTHFSTYVVFLRWLEWKISCRVESIIDNSWELAHSIPAEDQKHGN